MVALFQQTSQRLKYALVPTVAAVEGMALGGGCEFVMHSQRAVAALESYIGLVEVGRGLAARGRRPEGIRAARAARGRRAATPSPSCSAYFKQVAMARSLEERRERARDGLPQARATSWSSIPAELLYVAKQQARAMAESGVRPALAARADPGGRATPASPRSR